MFRKAIPFSLLFLFALLMMPRSALAQFASPTIDGSIAGGEYGTHTDGQNQQANGGTTWYMTWDNTNLYAGVSGAAVSEGAVLYLDKNPVTPINGGANSNGTLAGQGYDSASFAALQFRADFVSYFKSGYREYRSADGSGGWSGATSGFGTYADNGSSVRELAIPWSALGGRPSSFNWFGYVTSSGGFVYGEVPAENGSGFVGTSARFDRYYTVSSTADGSSTKPFAQNSYVFNSTTDISGFGAISVFDFTMNASGLTVTRADDSGGAGDWVIANDLVIGAGTVQFTQDANEGGASTVSGGLNILGGKLDMGATDEHLTVAGDVSIAGTLELSTSTANIFVGGNWTKTSGGVFSNNDSWTYFNGGDAQAITGAMSGSTNRFAKIIVQNNSTVTFNNNVGVETGLEVQAGSIFQTDGSADFSHELVGTAAVLDCIGTCTFDDLEVRNVNANGTTASGTLDVNGDFTIATATSSFTAAPAGALFTIAGDFISNKTSGTFSANGGTITFNGSGVQNLTLASAHAFNAVTVSSGAILAETQATDYASVTTLTNSGTVRRAKTVTAAGSVSFGLTGVSMNVDSISSSQTITVDRIDSDHPMAASGIAASSHRYWDISITGGTYQADLTFADSTIAGTGTQHTCRTADGGLNWDCVADDDGNHTNASTTRNNVTAFSSWQNCVSCSPTAIGLRALSAGQEAPWLVWVGIGIVAGWWLLLRKTRMTRIRTNIFE
jgi:hypothetical protein